MLPTLSLLFRNNLLFGWEKLFFNLIWSIALWYLLQTEFFIHFHLSEFQLKPIIISALIILSFKHFYFHFGIIGYLIVKYFFYDSVFLNWVLWPSNKKKMFFTSSLLQLYQETSSPNDINVSEYCSLENHLSLFHPQAKVSSLLEGIWILHQWKASVPNHSDVQDLLTCSCWRTKLLSDHGMETSVQVTTWGHPCRSWHGDICANHKIGTTVLPSPFTAAEDLTHTQVHQ